jgi:hypothetical protein
MDGRVEPRHDELVSVKSADATELAALQIRPVRFRQIVGKKSQLRS